MHQAQQHKTRGNALGNDRGQGDARHAHVQDNHREEVEHHVYAPGDEQKVQRTLGIADGAQNGRSKVIKHDDRHAGKVDLHVKRRLADDVLRRAHEQQERFGQQHADENQRNAGDETDRDGGVNRIAQLRLVARADIARRQHVCADRKTHKDVDEQVDQRRRGADRRERLTAGELADHNDVGGVEQQLQNAREHQRNGEQKHFSQQRAVHHVDLIRFFHFRLPT